MTTIPRLLKSVAFILLALCPLEMRIAWGQTPKAKAGSVAYADLQNKNKKVSVPYGTPFTITGDLKDVQIGKEALPNLLVVQTVAGDYTTSDGNKGTIAPTQVKAPVGKSR